jgi:short-subunit dehydrogenase
MDGHDKSGHEPTMTTRRPVTLITGASAGIGTELAHVFAEHGHALLLVARRESKLAELADAIAAKGHTRPLFLSVDLERADAVERLGDMMATLEVEPEIVVNNAGFGLLGTAESLDRDEQLAMIDLNVRTLTALSLAFVDSVKRHRGGILNVASVAAFLPGPGMAIYYATKAYVLSFSEALHRELAPAGVRVTVLCPGPVPTEFQVRAGATNMTSPALLTCSAERVAREGYRAFAQGRRLVVPGFVNKVVTVLAQLAPRGVVLCAVDLVQKGRHR